MRHPRCYSEGLHEDGQTEESSKPWLRWGEQRTAEGRGGLRRPVLPATWEGRQREKKTRGVLKSWGRREKSRLDMGLCAVLLICLSQAELGRPWAEEHEGKPLFLRVQYCCMYSNISISAFYINGIYIIEYIKWPVFQLSEQETCFSFLAYLFHFCWLDLNVVTGSTWNWFFDGILKPLYMEKSVWFSCAGNKPCHQKSCVWAKNTV